MEFIISVHFNLQGPHNSNKNGELIGILIGHLSMFLLCFLLLMVVVSLLFKRERLQEP